MDHVQLFVIGDGNLYFMGWLGKASDDQTNAINYLKTLKLLTQVGDYKATKATIIGAIRDLIDEAEVHLGISGDYHRYMQEHQHINGVHHYCENPNLFIARVGDPFTAFQLNGEVFTSIKS